MKLFQKFRKRELTPVERLAEYESEIAYNQSVIENAKASIQLLTKAIKFHKKIVKDATYLEDFSYDFWLSMDLDDCLTQIDDYNIALENAKSNLKYYEVLRDHLKKELDSQNSKKKKKVISTI